jgi:hypothetical protein
MKLMAAGIWLGLIVFGNAAAPPAQAQDRTHPQPAAKRGPKQKAAKKPKGEPHPNPPPKAESVPAAATPAAPPPMAADDSDVRREGGTEVKSLEFGGLDIEGQLKTPQMLYFLNRLKAEFDRPQLPHRSFIPELSRSTKEKDF